MWNTQTHWVEVGHGIWDKFVVDYLLYCRQQDKDCQVTNEKNTAVFAILYRDRFLYGKRPIRGSEFQGA